MPPSGLPTCAVAFLSLLAGVAYIAVIRALGGLTFLHTVIGMFACMAPWHHRLWRLFRVALPLLLVAMLYDSMRYYYWRAIAGHIHVAGPYLLEQQLFGLHSPGGAVLTPNEWFLQHQHPVLDIVCGFCYLMFLWQYVGATLYAHFAGKAAVGRFLGWTFFWLNTTGFLTYLTWPAAPPWYITAYGFGPARMNIAPAQAGASRFDALLGTEFFSAWYGAAIDGYGALPSLHVAYPFVVAWTVWRFGVLQRARFFAAGFCTLMCLSAVYLQHHYIIDVVSGLFYAAAVVSVVSRFTLREVI